MSSPVDASAALSSSRLRVGSLLFWVLTLLAIVAVPLIWILFPPLYEAEAWVECISPEPRPPGELVGPAVSDAQFERFVAGQACFALSSSVLSKVLEMPEVRATAWFAKADKARLRTELEGALTSVPAEHSNFFRVAMSCRAQTDPAVIVNKVVAVYLAQVRMRATERYRDELSGYAKELNALQSQIQQKLRQIQEFATTFDPGELHARDGQGPTFLEIAERQKQVAAFEVQCLEWERLVKLQSDPAGPVVPAEARQAVEQNPQVTTLASQVTNLEIDLAILARDESADPSRTSELKARLDATRQALSAMRANLLRDVLDTRDQQAQNAFADSQHAWLFAREKLASAQAKQADVDHKLWEYEVLRMELEKLEATKQRAEEYIREVEQVVRQQSAVRVESAQVAVDPLEPNPRPQIRATGIAVGVPALYGLLLLVYRRLTGVRSRVEA